MRKIKDIYYKALKSIRHSLLKTKIIVVVILGLILALSGILYFKSQTQSASANWWNETWKYRQSVTLPDHASLETNVYFQLTVDTSTLISVGKMQSDCGDLQFTSIDGNTLPHYIVSGCNTTTTTINILFDSYPAGEIVIYMYYGNPNTSNGFALTNFNVNAASNGTTTVNYQVNASGNDGDQNTSGVAGDITRTGLRVGNDSNTKVMASRFTSVAIPQGTSLISATFTGTASDTYNCGGCTLTATIYGEDADNSAILTAAASNISGRTRTSASTSAGSLTSVVLNTEYDFTVTTQVQEIIDRGGWSSGNALTILFVDSTSTANEWQEFFSYDGDPTKAPQLSITYGAGPATFGSEEITPGPMAYWQFDEGQGSTANDSVGSNNGILGTGNSAPTWVTDDQCISGKCLRFDGTSDVVVMNDISAVESINSLTISFWIKPTTAVLNHKFLVSKVNGTGGSWTINTAQFGNANRVAFSLCTVSNCSSLAGIYTTNDVISVGEWAYLTFTYDGSQGSNENRMQIYKNGFLQEKTVSGTIPTSIQDSSAGVAVGGLDVASTYSFTGVIDEVKIYGYVRSAAQIKADYNARGSTKGVSAQFGDDDMNRRLSDGLVAYWNMDAGTGTTLTDLSGNNYTGTLGSGTSAPTWSTGKFGSGLDFDGGDDVTSSIGISPFNTTDEITMSVWFKADSVASLDELITTSSNQGKLGFGPGGTGIPAGSIRVDGSTVAVSGNSVLTTGRWYMMTYTYKNKVARIYVDGVLDGTMTMSGAGDLNLTSGTFGLSQASTSGRYFDGIMDEARIYNRALDPSEVKALYEWAPGPAAYWNMEEGSGLYTYDTSGNGNIGTLSCNGAGCAKPNWTNGKFGKGMNFDTCTGTADRWIDAGSGSSIDNIWDGGGNVSLWLYPRSVSGQILNKNNDAWYLTYGVSGNMANITLIKIFATGNNRWTTGYVVPINSWSFISVAYNADSTTNNATIYVNGIPQATTLTGTPTGTRTDDSGGNLSIGDWGWHNNCGQQAHGILDEIRFYNYIRTPSQILEDMNGGHPIGGSPVGSQLNYWKMDEGYGDTVYDSAISEDDGNLADSSVCPGVSDCPTWTSDGKFGKALSFDGGDYFTAGNNNAGHDNGGSTPYTATLWFKSNTNPTNNYGLMGIVSGGGQDRFIQVTSAGLPRFYVYDGSENYATGITDVIDNEWHHLAGVFDGTNLHIYVDGKLEGSDTSSGSQNHSSPWVRFSHAAIGGYYDMVVGTIDEAKIYNAALTQEQIIIDMNRNGGIVMGSNSTGVGGTSPSTSGGREYCVPGDSSTCSTPVGEWKFEQGSGVTAIDTSGNSTNGTLFGNTWVAGKKGKALNFDGVDDGLDFGDPSSGVLDFADGTNITISFWMNRSSFDSAHTVVAKKNGAGTGAAGFIVLVGANDKITLSVSDGDGANKHEVDSTTTITSPGWNHVTVVYNDSSATASKIYINGVDDNATNTTTGTFASIGNLSNSLVFAMGSESDGDAHFHGQLDEVRIYNYARTAAQVAWEYNRGAPIAYYKLNECTGSTAYDSSISQNNGTITIGATGTQTSAGTCSSGISTEAWNNGTSGKLGTSLNFDGTNDYVDLGNPTELQIGASTPFTIAMWTKLNSDTQSFLVSKGGDDGSNQSWRISYISTLDRYEFYTSSNGTSGSATACGPTSGSSITVGQWYHIAAVYNPSTTSRTCYVNGKAGNTGNAGSSLFNSTANLYVGKEHSSSTLQFYPGQVDDLGIYNYPLTSAQILTVMAGGAVNFR